MINPSNRDAQRQKRLMEMRKERANKPKGFFAKMMEVFGK